MQRTCRDWLPWLPASMRSTNCKYTKFCLDQADSVIAVKRCLFVRCATKPPSTLSTLSTPNAAGIAAAIRFRDYLFNYRWDCEMKPHRFNFAKTAVVLLT